MSSQELAIEDCVEQKVAQGMSACQARPACEQEMGMGAAMEEPIGMQKDTDVPFQEGKDKKPDEDGDGIPDWADKKKGEDDNEEEKEELDEMSAMGGGAVEGYAGQKRRKKR